MVAGVFKTCASTAAPRRSFGPPSTALHLDNIPEVFDSLIDCGLLHVFSEDDRARYVKGLATIVYIGRQTFPAVFQRRGGGGRSLRL